MERYSSSSGGGVLVNHGQPIRNGWLGGLSTFKHFPKISQLWKIRTRLASWGELFLAIAVSNYKLNLTTSDNTYVEIW
jgi:hypothetical protein